MGLWDKLRRASNYFRKLWRSLGPDSYGQYKRGRKYERQQADRAREHAQDSAEREREETERASGYEERYTREREGDIARERTEPAEEQSTLREPDLD
jgi:hypothetical protein